MALLAVRGRAIHRLRPPRRAAPGEQRALHLVEARLRPAPLRRALHGCLRVAAEGVASVAELGQCGGQRKQRVQRVQAARLKLSWSLEAFGSSF